MARPFRSPAGGGRSGALALPVRSAGLVLTHALRLTGARFCGGLRGHRSMRRPGGLKGSPTGAVSVTKRKNLCVWRHSIPIANASAVSFRSVSVAPIHALCGRASCADDRKSKFGHCDQAESRDDGQAGGK